MRASRSLLAIVTLLGCEGAVRGISSTADPEPTIVDAGVDRAIAPSDAGSPSDAAAPSAPKPDAAGTETMVDAGIDAAPPPREPGATPPMGWNSWNPFRCDIDEQLIRDTADALVQSGMREAGYEYVVVDDCWAESRAADGTIVADAARFPSGIAALADYVHGRELKFGLYTDVGTATCEGRPGSHDHQEQDAATYASWGVDYVKADWCNSDGLDAQTEYTKLSQALQASGRAMLLAICNWGESEPWKWGRGVGVSWRTTKDILNCYDCSTDWGGAGWLGILDRQHGLEAFSGPFGWNDPDMLQVGNEHVDQGFTPLTLVESRAHFSFWSLLAAPLMAGNDLTTMSDDIRQILTNSEVIAVNQDELGAQGTRVLDYGDGSEVWSKRLSGAGRRAVILFNRNTDEREISAAWPDLALAPSSAHVRDLWTHSDAGNHASSYAASVPGHGVVMLLVEGSDAQ